MAKDVFSIPAMSAEVERLFSSAKLMVSDQRSSLKASSIEVGECVRSWIREGFVLGDYFEYLKGKEKSLEHWKYQNGPTYLD